MIRQEKEYSPARLTWGKLIGLAVIALVAEPELLGEFVGLVLILSPVVIPLVIYFRRKKHRKEHQSALENTTYTICREEKAYLEESRKFCRHKDKAIHHVGQGKEVDPWDRPDIDISKYQRKE